MKLLNELLEIKSFWWIFTIAIFFLGTVFSSFCDCIAYRMAKGEKIKLFSRSYCETCKARLGALELVPVFGYLILKGRCRHCGEKIPIIYLLSEISGGLYCLAIWLSFGLSIKLLEAVVIYFVLHMATLIDIETLEIPNIFCLILLALFVILLPFRSELGSYVLSAVLGGGLIPLVLVLISKIIERKKKRTVLGGGDIKLLIAVGLFLGGNVSLLNILLMCIFGLVFAFLNHKKNEPFAFAPFILMSAMICIFFGEDLITRYIALFN